MMKRKSILPMILGLLALPASAQPGFSVGREIRYPTRFEVTPPQRITTANPQQPFVSPITQYPSVIPSDFQTRRTGTSVSTTEINISGRVVIVNSHDGSELVTLRSSGGTVFRVATGSTFSMNKHPFRADGFKNGIYQIRSLANQQLYYFVPNQ